MSKNTESRSRKSSTCARFWKGELNLVKKYFEGATIDGIEHVTDGRSRVRRIVWGLILLSSLGVCLFFLIGHFTSFANKPTSTTLNIVKPDEGLPFPAVTFCNLNPVSRSYAEARQLESFLSFYLSPFNNLFESSRNQCESVIDRFSLENSMLSIDELFRSGGEKLDSLVASCQFITNSTTTVDCIGSLIPVVTELGLCYSYNYIVNNPEDTLINLNGNNYGLKVTLNISQNDYIASNDNDAGAVVTVHERDTLPDPIERGLTVPPGMHARIGISLRRFVDNTGKGECRDPESSHPLFPDLRYSPSGCRVDALYRNITDDTSCDCIEYNTDVLDRLYSNERNCTLSDVCCLGEVKDSIKASTLCPPSCDQTYYDPVISYSKFPYKRLAAEVSAFTGSSVENIENDLLSFSVYFTDLYVQHSETVISYGPRELVADIGGTLGLFLGASVITLMEIFILFYDQLKSLCCTSKKVRKGWNTFEMKVLHSAMDEEEESTPAPESDNDDSDEKKLQKEMDKNKENQVKTSDV